MAWNGAPWPVWGSAPKTANMIDHKGHKGEIIGEKNGYYVIHCTTCILNHCMPLPSEEFLADYYANQFYQFSKQDYIARYEEDRWWWEIHHEYTMHQALKFLSESGAWDMNLNHLQDLKVLDIGSGPGIFLDVAKRFSFQTYGVRNRDEVNEYGGCKDYPGERRRSSLQTYGIELNADLINHVRNRGHNMFLGTLKDFIVEVNAAQYTPPKTYDMIHLYEVLEHVPDPETFLDDIRGLLNLGGVLHVVVPNDFNLLQLEAQAKYNLPQWWLAPPEHLNYFEPKTLQLMVRRVGFKIKDIRTTYPLEGFMVYDGCVYVGNDKLGRQCHKERMRYESEKRQSGDFETLMNVYRGQCADPYSGTTGREIVLTAIREI